MRQISTLVLVSFLLTFSLPAAATDGTTLSDFQEGTKEWFRGECDAGATNVVNHLLPKIGTRIVETVTFSSGDTSYFVNVFEKPDHFFWKDAGSSEPPVELDQDTWFKKIKAVSVNYYAMTKNRISATKKQHNCRMVKK